VLFRSEALEAHFKGLELDPNFYKFYASAGRVYIQKRMYRDAIAMLEKALSLSGEIPSVISALAQSYAMSGDRGRALRTEAQLEALAKTKYVPATSFALVRLALGEPDHALDLLESACERHEMTMSVLKVHPAYDPLRGTARFEALLKRIGLAG
jgi:tetratricopeptide (TPR) repeat protein